jgi:hypothetical protein
MEAKERGEHNPSVLFALGGDRIRCIRKREVASHSSCNAIWWERGEIDVCGLYIITRDSKKDRDFVPSVA